MSMSVNPYRFGSSFILALPGLNNWFDTSLGDPTGYTTIGGSDVTQINDLSGNGNHATKYSGSSSFTTGLSINGLTALSSGRPIGYSFNGVSQDSFTIIAVSIPDTTCILIGPTAAGVGTFGYESDGKLTGECRSGAFNRQPTRSGLNFANCDAMTHDGTTVKIFSYDPVTPTQSNSAGSLSGGTFNDIGYGSPGSVQGFSGFFGELILCNGALGTTDRTNVFNYLIAKWGVP